MATEPGSAVEREETVRRDAERGARHVGHGGRAAGRDDDVARGVGLAADLDPARARETGAGADERRAALLHVLEVDAAQPLDVSVAARLQGREVMAHGREREAVIGGIVERVGDVGGVVHELLRHAADVDAGAAELARLRDARRARRGAPRAARRRGRRCRRRSRSNPRTASCSHRAEAARADVILDPRMAWILLVALAALAAAVVAAARRGLANLQGSREEAWARSRPSSRSATRT